MIRSNTNSENIDSQAWALYQNLVINPLATLPAAVTGIDQILLFLQLFEHSITRFNRADETGLFIAEDELEEELAEEAATDDAAKTMLEIDQQIASIATGLVASGHANVFIDKDDLDTPKVKLAMIQARNEGRGIVSIEIQGRDAGLVEIIGQDIYLRDQRQLTRAGLERLEFDVVLLIDDKVSGKQSLVFVVDKTQDLQLKAVEIDNVPESQVQLQEMEQKQPRVEVIAQPRTEQAPPPPVEVDPDVPLAPEVVELEVNAPPTIEIFNPLASLAENSDTASERVVGDIVVNDDSIGQNNLMLIGADKDLFRIDHDNAQLILRSGVTLNFEQQPQLNVGVAVDDPTIGTTVEDTANLRINIIDIDESPLAANQTQRVNEDSHLFLTLEDFHPTSNGYLPLAVKIIDLPSAGSLSFFNGSEFQAVSAPQEFTTEQLANNVLRFTPDSNENGDAYTSFNFQLLNADNENSDIASLVIDVNAVADSAVVNGDFTTVTIFNDRSEDNFDNGQSGWSFGVLLVDTVTQSDGTVHQFAGLFGGSPGEALLEQSIAVDETAEQMVLNFTFFTRGDAWGLQESNFEYLDTDFNIYFGEQNDKVSIALNRLFVQGQSPDSDGLTFDVTFSHSNVQNADVFYAAYDVSLTLKNTATTQWSELWQDGNLRVGFGVDSDIPMVNASSSGDTITDLARLYGWGIGEINLSDGSGSEYLDQNFSGADAEQQLSDWLHINTTTDGNGIYLEPFAGSFSDANYYSDNQYVAKTFQVDPASSQITISFDFLELGVWNNDFKVFINGQVFEIGTRFISGTNEGNISGNLGSIGTYTLTGDDTQHHVNLLIDNSVGASDIEFGFLQTMFDEFEGGGFDPARLGIDNIIVQSDAPSEYTVDVDLSAVFAHLPISEVLSLTISNIPVGITFNLGEVQADGRVVFTDANGHGNLDSELSGLQAMISSAVNNQAIALTVTATSREPSNNDIIETNLGLVLISAADDSVFGFESQVLNFDVLANDVVRQGEGFSLDIVSVLSNNPSSLITASDISIVNNQLVLNPIGLFPNLDSHSEPEQITVTYQITDENGLTDTAEAIILMNGVNTAPTITSTNAATIAELDAIVGEVVEVMQVTATDADPNDSLNFRVAGGQDAEHFTIDANSGQLSFSSLPPYDSAHGLFYQVLVEVTDNGFPPLTEQQLISVQVNYDGVEQIIGDQTGQVFEVIVDEGGTISNEGVSVVIESPLTGGLLIDLDFDFIYPDGSALYDLSTTPFISLRGNDDDNNLVLRLVPLIDIESIQMVGNSPEGQAGVSFIHSNVVSSPSDGGLSLNFEGINGTDAVTVTLNNGETLQGFSMIVNNAVEPTKATGQLTAIGGGASDFIVQNTVTEHGYFTITESGAWTYFSNTFDPEVNALAADQELTETIVVTTTSGSTLDLHMTTVGTDDGAVIFGVSGNTTEGNLSLVSGRLLLFDPDAELNEFNGQTATNGEYGTFSLDAAGNYQYTMDQSAVNHLTRGLTAQKIYLTFPELVDDEIPGVSPYAALDLSDGRLRLLEVIGLGGEVADLRATDEEIARLHHIDFAKQEIIFNLGISDSLLAANYLNVSFDVIADDFLEKIISSVATDVFEVTTSNGETHEVSIIISGALDAPIMSASMINISTSQFDQATIEGDMGGDVINGTAGADVIRGEGQAREIELDVRAQLVDDFASNFSLMITGLPSAASLNVGSKQADGSWVIEDTNRNGFLTDELAQLMISLPPSIVSELDITLIARVVQDDGSIAEQQAVITLPAYTGDDEINGFAGEDIIQGDGGHDVISGGGDADVIYGDYSQLGHDQSIAGRYQHATSFSGLADASFSDTFILNELITDLGEGVTDTFEGWWFDSYLKPDFLVNLAINPSLSAEVVQTLGNLSADVIQTGRLGFFGAQDSTAEYFTPPGQQLVSKTFTHTAATTDSTKVLITFDIIARGDWQGEDFKIFLAADGQQDTINVPLTLSLNASLIGELNSGAGQYLIQNLANTQTDFDQLGLIEQLSELDFETSAVVNFTTIEQSIYRFAIEYELPDSIVGGEIDSSLFTLGFGSALAPESNALWALDNVNVTSFSLSDDLPEQLIDVTPADAAIPYGDDTLHGDAGDDTVYGDLNQSFVYQNNFNFVALQRWYNDFKAFVIENVPEFDLADELEEQFVPFQDTPAQDLYNAVSQAPEKLAALNQLMIDLIRAFNNLDAATGISSWQFNFTEGMSFEQLFHLGLTLATRQSFGPFFGNVNYGVASDEPILSKTFNVASSGGADNRVFVQFDLQQIGMWNGELVRIHLGEGEHTRVIEIDLANGEHAEGLSGMFDGGSYTVESTFLSSLDVDTSQTIIQHRFIIELTDNHLWQNTQLDNWTDGALTVGFSSDLDSLSTSRGFALDNIALYSDPEFSQDVLNGGDGDDFLDGGAGQDRIHAGAGDDTVVFDPLDTLNAGIGQLDGGTDSGVLGLGDVLFIRDTDEMVDLSQLSAGQITNFEKVKFAGDNLFIDDDFVLALNPENTAVIEAGANATIELDPSLGSWDQAEQVILADGNTYQGYSIATDEGLAQVYISIEANIIN